MGEQVIWILVIAGVGIWMAYLACGLLIAKACAAGPAWLRALYWVLPIVVGTVSGSALSFAGEYSKSPLGLRGWLGLVALMTLIGYLCNAWCRCTFLSAANAA